MQHTYKSVAEQLLDDAEELNQQATCTVDLAAAYAEQSERGYDPYNSHTWAVQAVTRWVPEVTW